MNLQKSISQNSKLCFGKIYTAVLGKLSKLKSGEIWETVQSGDDPPLAGLEIFELGTFWKINLGIGTFLKRNDPLKFFWNKLNMSDIMVYLAMFSTTIGPHNMKMSHQFISLWYPLKLGTFLISEDHPLFWTFPNWNLGLFWFFDDPPPNWTNSQILGLFRLESFPKGSRHN